MKELYAKSTIILVFFITSSITFSQGRWEFTGGPYGGIVTSLFKINQDSILVGTSNSGLHLYLPKEQKYKLLYYEEFFRKVNSVIRVKDSTVLLIVNAIEDNIYPKRKLLKSNKQFDKWEYIDDRPIHTLVTLNDADTEYIFGIMPSRIGIMRSSDFGYTWDYINTPAYFIDNLMCDQNNKIIYAASSSAIAELHKKATTASKGIFVSDDFGNSWRNLVDINTITVEVDEKGFIYAGKEYSTDFGESWHECANMEQAYSRGGVNIYGGNWQGFYVSNNYGENWEIIKQGIEVNEIIEYDENILLIGAYNGLYIYDETDESITNVSRNLFENRYYQFYESSSGVKYLVGSSGIIHKLNNTDYWESSGSYFNGALYGYDYGTDWKRHTYAVVENNDGRLYAGTNIEGQLYYTENNMMYWSFISFLSFPSEEIWSLKCDRNNNIFLGLRYAGIKILPNGSDEYLATEVRGTSILSIYIDNNNFIYAGSRYGQVFVSRNDGEDWHEYSTGLQGDAVISVQSLGDLIFAGTYYGIYMLNATTETWEDIGYNLPDHTAIRDMKCIENTIYISLGEKGVLKSTDEGETWQKIGSKNDDLISDKLLISRNGFLYMASNKGVYKLSEPIVSIKHNEEEIPGGFELLRNFPNPFNPSTQITYSLPYNARISIKVYDLLGGEIAELVNRDMNAGTHSVQFNGINLTSGVYVVRMEAGNFNQSRKILLLK